MMSERRNCNTCFYKTKKTVLHTYFLWMVLSIIISAEDIDTKTEPSWEHLNCFQSSFILLAVYSLLKFELSLLLSLSLTLFLFFLVLLFRVLTHPRRSKHTVHCSTFMSLTSLLIFWCCVNNNFFKPLFLCSAESSADGKKRPVAKEWSQGEGANLNLFPALIGTLTTAVNVINKTIQLERWVLVLPSTAWTVQLLCESWSRKWIVISFFGHERLL